MQALISSISVSNRVRKDFGDLESLMDSLKRCGQLNPIVVTREMELIAGHRRLLAAQRLGWKTVDVIFVDGISEERRLEIELEENIHRKDFSPEELLEGVKRLEAIRHPKFGTRLKNGLKKFFSKFVFWKSRKKKPNTDETIGSQTHNSYDSQSKDDDLNYGI